MLTIGKRDVALMAGVLDEDHATVEDAAKAALEAAFALYVSKARFVVAGQLMWSGGFIDSADAAAAKIAVGPYATEGQAQSAAESLVISTRTHEEMRAWVLPVWSGTPAAFYGERAEERKRQEMLGKTGLEARLQRRQDWLKANPGALILPPEIDEPWE